MTERARAYMRTEVSRELRGLALALVGFAVVMVGSAILSRALDIPGWLATVAACVLYVVVFISATGTLRHGRDGRWR